jgi:hypothetical protein
MNSIFMTVTTARAPHTPHPHMRCAAAGTLIGSDSSAVDCLQCLVEAAKANLDCLKVIFALVPVGCYIRAQVAKTGWQQPSILNGAAWPPSSGATAPLGPEWWIPATSSGSPAHLSQSSGPCSASRRAMPPNQLPCHSWPRSMLACRRPSSLCKNCHADLPCLAQLWPPRLLCACQARTAQHAGLLVTQ